MSTILLIRTGRTEYDCQGRVQGTTDVPLSDQGRQEVERAARELETQEVQALYAGPGQAAIETADILAPVLGCKVKTLDHLHNMDLGLWQGMLVDDLKSKQPKLYRQWQEHPETVCPPQGETLSSARERLQTTLAKLLKKHKSGVVALVVPEPLASLVRNTLKDDRLGNLWQAGCEDRPTWELIPVPAQVGTA